MEDQRAITLDFDLNLFPKWRCIFIIGWSRITSLYAVSIAKVVPIFLKIDTQHVGAFVYQGEIVDV